MTMGKTRKFVALTRFEHDGEVTKPEGTVTLPYASDTDKDYADLLVKTKVLKEHGEGQDKKETRSR